jgi:hypothetical protein
LRSGFNVTGRDAPGNHATDWNQLQWATTAAHQWEWVRGQMEASTSWIGGPLSEPYRLVRSSMSADANLQACRVRLSYDIERRKQDRSTSFNSQAMGWLGSLQCPLPMTSSWSLTLALRDGQDKPDTLERPGGKQRLRSTGLRLTGSPSGSTRVDINLRISAVQDATGYSALLEGNALRHLSLRQLSLEVSEPLDRFGWAGIEAVGQAQSARQSSNLHLFKYRADSLFAGLRWTW